MEKMLMKGFNSVVNQAGNLLATGGMAFSPNEQIKDKATQFKVLMLESLAGAFIQGPSMGAGEAELPLSSEPSSPMAAMEKMLWDLNGIKPADASLTAEAESFAGAGEASAWTAKVEETLNLPGNFSLDIKDEISFSARGETRDGSNKDSSLKIDGLYSKDPAEKFEGLAWGVKPLEGHRAEKGYPGGFEISENPAARDAFKGLTPDGNGKPDGLGPEQLSEIQGKGAAAAVESAGGLQGHQVQVKTPEAAEPYSQIGKEVQARLSSKGPREFTMELEPGNLGKIDVKLKISEGRLVIDIMAANTKTQALLSSQVDKLVLNLGLQNVKVENVLIGHQNEQEGERQEQSFLAGKENSPGRENARGNPQEKGPSNMKSQSLGWLEGLTGQDPGYKDFSRMNYTV